MSQHGGSTAEALSALRGAALLCQQATGSEAGGVCVQVVPGAFGFIAQFNEGRASKKRPTEFCVDKVRRCAWLPSRRGVRGWAAAEHSVAACGRQLLAAVPWRAWSSSAASLHRLSPCWWLESAARSCLRQPGRRRACRRRGVCPAASCLQRARQPCARVVLGPCPTSGRRAHLHHARWACGRWCSRSTPRSSTSPRRCRRRCCSSLRRASRAPLASTTSRWRRRAARPTWSSST